MSFKTVLDLQAKAKASHWGLKEQLTDALLQRGVDIKDPLASVNRPRGLSLRFFCPYIDGDADRNIPNIGEVICVFLALWLNTPAEACIRFRAEWLAIWSLPGSWACSPQAVRGAVEAVHSHRKN